MKQSRKIIFGLVLLVIVGLIFYLQSQKPARVSPGASKIQLPPATSSKEQKSKRYTVAKEITTPDGFINTDKISLMELVGKKVVLIDFWTYSCINCQRTIPYLNAWHEKYKDMGLVIIGVHTPEFRFEQKYENVAAAAKKFGIKYPVVLDNDFSTWNAYGNRYWPRKYIMDIDGFIVYDHIGEGAYEETEKKIQELLTERLAVLGMRGEMPGEMVKPAGVETSQAQSPEIYFGAFRNSRLANGRAGELGRQILSEPAKVSANKLYLVGDWQFEDEFAKNLNSGAKIIFRYQAKNVFLVSSAREPVRVKVLRDGVPLSTVAGADAAENSAVTIQEERLYELIRDPRGAGEHTLELIIENPGLEAYTFTFG